MQDSEGGMWFGTRGGVSHYDGKKIVNFTAEDGLPYGSGVLCMLEDRRGRLWLATDGGVNRYEDERFVNVATKIGLEGVPVRDILEDKVGHLWFGTGRRPDGAVLQPAGERQGIYGVGGLSRAYFSAI